MKKPKLTFYRNAFIIRRHNSKIEVVETDRGYGFEFLICDDNASIPACSHETLKGKVRRTRIHISKQSMDDLVRAYLEFNGQKK